uniref:threonine--tRNA ligase n=1 Tax=Salarias fasciatus TaxID=181472 RepID=A0A672I951_SALFA
MSELQVDGGKKGGPEGGKDGGKKKAKNAAGDSGGKGELTPPPQYIDERLSLYTKLKAEHDALMAERAAKDSKPIKVTLPDGKVVEAESWKTTPYQVACGISQGLADNTVIAKVNNGVWDLDRPLEDDCSLQLLKFDDEEAQAVYWHSSAHILGEAMERVYGGCLCYGPPIESGFYYDMFLDNNEGVSSNDFPGLETLCKKIIKEKQPFERLEIKKETLLEMFKYNKFKCRILNEKVTTPTTTVYRCGPLIDLCRGPHVRHTGKIKALKIHKNSSTYWEGKADMETLQRIYGISFPDPKMLKEWEKFQEEAKNRDHRKLGRVRAEICSAGMQQRRAQILLCFYYGPQIEGEIKGCLDFLRTVYDVFGFTFKLNLSTRPEKFLGDPEVWDQAEKIDIQIKDAIGRYHQCATIQLDFQLPIRFNLSFVSHDGDDKKRPVIIHRAILGSVERMIAILTENYGGKWPLWLSPRQVMVVPVGPTCDEYAQKVRQDFHSSGFMADVDLDPGCTLNKKIRNAQLAQYNFILVVGEKEKTSNTVNVRTRDNKVHGERSVEECIERLKQLKTSKSRSAEEEF